jgi:hypothetical protein
VGSSQGSGEGTGCWNRLERLDGVWSVPVIDAAAEDPDR